MERGRALTKNESSLRLFTTVPIDEPELLFLKLRMMSNAPSSPRSKKEAEMTG